MRAPVFPFLVRAAFRLTYPTSCHQNSNFRKCRRDIPRCYGAWQRRRVDADPASCPNTATESEARRYSIDAEAEKAPHQPAGSHSLKELVPLVQNLLEISPVIRVDGNHIRVLREPREFHENLKDAIIKAKRRVILAALYIGQDEIQLTTAIRTAIEQRRRAGTGDPLKIVVLVDCLRGTRGGSKSTASLLLPLVTEYPDIVQVKMYHTPDLFGLGKRLCPPRFNEAVGLMHIKAYVTDDNVILSGANLSHDYFTNRQDRYISFEKNKVLADYFTDLVETVGTCSYTVVPKSATSAKTPPLVDYELHALDAPDPDRQRKKFKAFATERINRFLDRWKRDTMSTKAAMLSSMKNGTKDDDTYLIPSIQMAPFGVRQDEEATSAVLQSVNDLSHNDGDGRRYSRWNLHVTSGYFNFGQRYIDLLLGDREGAVVNIIASSPEANGFFNSKGVSKYLPAAYTHLERKFLKDVKRRRRDEHVTIEEWKRPNWTYHSKGLWCYQPSERLPTLTMIGSPNFGSRSTERDLEAQVILITNHKPLRKQLHEELQHLQEYSKPVNLSTLDVEERRVPFLVKIATAFIKTML